MIFRLLAGIDWASEGLLASRPYLDRPLRRVDCFRRLLSRALDDYSKDA
jgi:hypothetical protein